MSRNPKFPHVSLYQPTQSGGAWRLTTCEIEGRRITRRLGKTRANAERYAARVSEWLDQWRSRLIDTPKLLQLLGETLPAATCLDRYRSHLRSKGRARKYVETIVPRIRHLLELADVSRIGQLNARAVARGLQALRDTRHPSDQTVRHYARAAQQFGRFAHRSGWIAADPLVGLEAVPVRTIARRRRPPTPLELRILLDHTATREAGRRWLMTGEERALLYAFALATGLRAGEIRAVRLGWIDLEAGVVSLPGSVTKNGQDTHLPLAAWLIDRLGPFTRGEPGRRLFPHMPESLALMLRRDLAAARAAWIGQAKTPAEAQARQAADTLQYRTEAGFLDFHALRHAYVSRLVDSRATVREAQTLARHSTAELTIGRYAHAEAQQLRAVVDRLPDPFAAGNETQPTTAEGASAKRSATPANGPRI